ncbi:MAG: MotA/TolQ/ExbB proton channel family protein [Verrucomicrobia bacterium]|nr:MotA/TolQ/ExbB proton channel family protein [Verrucomicrobiota bacterium]
MLDAQCSMLMGAAHPPIRRCIDFYRAFKYRAIGMNRFLNSFFVFLAQQPQASPTPGSTRETVLKLLEAGGWVMIPLILASVLALGLIIACLFSLRRGTVVTRRFMETADALLRKRDYLGLIAASNRHSSAIARITARTLDFATKNPSAPASAIREVADTEGARVASSLNQRIIYLADIATLAPMLGLLGTVVGIINSFSVLANNTSQSRQTLLAGGVGQALVATAGGLIVGIIAMTFYSLFRGRVSTMISDLESATTHILNIIVAHRARRTEPSSVLESEDR